MFRSESVVVSDVEFMSTSMRFDLLTCLRNKVSRMLSAGLAALLKFTSTLSQDEMKFLKSSPLRPTAKMCLVS